MASRGTVHDPRACGDQWPRYQRHWSAAPAPELAWCVERYWAAEWDYRDQLPYQQLMLPYPNVHLSFRGDAPALVRGVARRYVVRELVGAERVFGVAFRPGCFRPFLGAPVRTITDRSIDAREVFGPDLPLPAVAAAPDAQAQRQLVERFLRAYAPPPDPAAEQAARIVASIAAEPELTRVDDLAGRLGTSVRRVQRQFAEYVGVGPKWVIRRYRLREVTDRMAAGGEIDWARLAVELGYADQAHLTRDFTAMLGESPTAYMRRYSAGLAPRTVPVRKLS